MEVLTNEKSIKRREMIENVKLAGKQAIRENNFNSKNQEANVSDKNNKIFALIDFCIFLWLSVKYDLSRSLQ